MPELPLVGRERELAILATLLDGIEAGGGAIALVSGEPGIGKSRLLEAASDHARGRGYAVVWGRAWEIGGAPPLWPWIEALRGLLARPGGRGGADALLQLVPELDRRTGAAPVTDPFAIHDAVASYLAGLCDREPIVVVLDDLHAADASTLRLAELLAPQLRTMRAALLGSYRDVEARLAPAVESALARLGRRGETIALHRLDLAAVGQLVAATTGAPDVEASRMIHTASDGNPLFVQELLKLLATRGATTNDVPAGVRAVLRERLALLAPATVALLQAAAIVGRTFGVALAAEVAGVTAAALEDAIAEAAGAEVVIAGEPGQYRFSHALVAETLTSSLTAPVRAKLHRRAAEVLERRHANDPSTPFAEIAHHWRSAGSDAAPQALVALERAAAAAKARVAFLDAAELYGTALAVLAEHAPGDTRRRAEYLIEQSESFTRGGDRERAKAACVAATELATSLGDALLYTRAALAYGADVHVAVIDQTLIHVLEQALGMLPGSDGPWRAQVMARLAAARTPSPDTRVEVALAHEAIDMARRLGDPAVLYEVLFRGIGALTDFERPEIRAPLNREVARMAGAAGDRARQLRSLQRLAFDMIDLGDLAGFLRTVDEYQVIGEATGQLRYRWVPIMFQAMRAQWEGRADDERRLSDEAFDIRGRLGEPVDELRVVRRFILEGIPPEQAERISRTIAGGHPVFGRMIRAWAHALAGRAEAARADLDSISPHPAWRDVFLPLQAIPMVTPVACLLRDTALAERLYQRALLERGRPQMSTSHGFILIGMTDHDLMRLAAVLGRMDEVEPFAQSALALCERLGAEPLARKIREDRDRILDERPVPRRAASPPPPDVTFTQEGELWTVRGCGELCRMKDSRGMQMLARLVASPHEEIHALDLAGADVVDAGDSGEVLDAKARAAYRERLRDLQAELAEAEQWNDAGRRERITDEIEALAAQLSGAVGLGNRERRTGQASERARQNARRRIADAMQRIADACPELGKHLSRAIRTGTTCSYVPDR